MPPTFRPRGMRTKRERGRDHDQRRREEKPWRKWYALKAWKDRRRDQLQKEPLCRRHLARGEVVAANTANHVEPHRGDWDLFIGGELESLCKTCHDVDVQREERAGGVGRGR